MLIKFVSFAVKGRLLEIVGRSMFSPGFLC